MALLSSLRDGSIDFGMALRGYGDVEWNDNKEQVITTLSISSFDYVYRPSHLDKKNKNLERE
jgi:hypothetical protein